MVRILSTLLLTNMLVVLCLSSSHGSLYHPDDPSLTLPARPDGTGEALPFDEFKRRFYVITNIANPAQKTEDRTRIESRAIALSQQRSLTPDQTLGLAVDLLHLGAVEKSAEKSGRGFGTAPAMGNRLDAEQVFNHLIPMVRSRPNYYVLSTLAHLYAARGDWAQAMSHLESALLDFSPPPPVSGVTVDQQRWQTRLDKDYVLPLFRRYQKEKEATERGRVSDREIEPVPPLFPVSGDPVKFVNDAGQYEPGKLTAAEKAKLPADAIAIVQQLLLWFPGDSRLYWLLAELYAAEDNLEAADSIFDELSWGRQFTNRKVMMDHRAAVKSALEAKKIAAEEDAKKAYPVNWWTIGGYFAIVAAVVGFAAYRSIRRGIRCNRGGC